MGSTRESARKSRREERKEETRQELVATAMQVFGERGFHAGSLQQIAGQAGYSTGAIYHHFGGKDELFLAAFESYALSRVGEVVAVFESSGGGLASQCRALADHWMARQAADPSFMIVALEFFLHSLRSPPLRKALAHRLAAVRLAVGRLIDQGARAQGLELPLPADELATVLRELGIGLAMAKLADPEAIPDRLYGDFVELFFELAGADDGTAAALEENRAR